MQGSMMNEAVRGYQHRSAGSAPVQRAGAGVDAVAGRSACAFRAAAGLRILVSSPSRVRGVAHDSTRTRHALAGLSRFVLILS